MSTETESYLGSGVIYLNGYDVGQCSAADFTLESEEKTLKNSRGGGGNANVVQRITKVGLALTLHTLNQHNLALALRATASTGQTTAVNEEPAKAVKGGLTELSAMVDISKTVTVKSGTTTIEAKHYDIRPVGILLKDSSNIADGTELTVSYTPKARNVIEALTQEGNEYRVVFDGLNEADSGRETVVKVHRWKPKPASNFGLIGEDFASLNLDGECLSDTSQPFGKSQFFYREYATA